MGRLFRQRALQAPTVDSNSQVEQEFLGGLYAIVTQGCGRRTFQKIWNDNEKFLLQPATYRRDGMQSITFPPNSGDLNPIETVWAWLRRDLARLELEDLSRGRDISVAQFRQRAAHLLASYGVAKLGEAWSPLQKLIRGMPGRLAKCRRNLFGRCGK